MRNQRKPSNVDYIKETSKAENNLGLLLSVICVFMNW
jgi:hypothetical protein